MSTPVISVKRARIHLELYGSGVLRDINVVDEAAYSFSEDTIKKKSTNEVVGTIASQTISTDGTLTLKLGDTSYDNFVLAVRASTATQAPVTDGTFTYPELEAGQSFKLPHSNITAMTVTGKVQGVDYKFYRASGIVVALTDNITAIPACSYSSGTTKRAGITAGGDQYFTVHVTDVLNGEYTCLYRARALLPDNISLISPDQFGVYDVKFELLLDDTKPADAEMGQFGFKDVIQ
ncbi:hypothetical protein RugamoR57_37560 [Duganella caerulea]|uniref:hypothetical protein n=1 Tax=Duganella caerulea TaxID=2885762 RepID=UPI0030EA6A0E